jgi:hypothetical protein
MGMGMGMSMMPTMSAALQTLTDHMVARGSTLLNIVQQVAGSCGTAVMSVVLTDQLTGSRTAGPAIAAQQNPALAQQIPPNVLADGLNDAASSFATSFTVAFGLLILTFVAAFFLPRHRPPVSEQSRDAVPTVIH